jgi:(1->4)-alpha-D-glucan 1-alpha-D-glucosylmutase
VVVEKILIDGERLRKEWPVHGTTGYEFLGLVGGLFVDPEGRRALAAVHGRYTGIRDSYTDVAYESRKLVLDVSMSSELTVLARKLDRISEQHRFARDFTLNSLQSALAEVIACFPVYRTYVRAETGAVAPEDRRIIETAVRLARRRNPATSESVFDFIASVLLLQDPEGLDDAQRRERRDFVMRFQQITGPVMAKGLEDTASYRYYPLASQNEVGGDPEAEVTVEIFHRANAERQKDWPHSMAATSTHDTKRGEDVRARIAVLSEVAPEFETALLRWREAGASHRTVVDDAEAPDASAEYLLYQTLVGTWPVGTPGRAPTPEYTARIQAYMRKALREAKLRTSWVSPNAPYEQAVDDFVAALLDPVRGRQFLREIETFLLPMARAGLLNSVCQTALKIAAPGVPDFYQGSELWEFSLVDPDNRRPVDFARRRRLLEEIDAPEPAAERARLLLDEIEDGRLKLLVTSRGLRFRRERPRLFATGSYVPLPVRGARGGHVVAFARIGDEGAALALGARFFTRIPWPPVGAAAWGDAVVGVEGTGGAAFRDALTERELRARTGAGGLELPLAEVFADLPLALLERIS